MSRKEDFEKAATDYCEDHSHCIYFEAGAEYGYQYAVEKACEWLESMSGYTVYGQKANLKNFRKAMEE